MPDGDQFTVLLNQACTNTVEDLVSGAYGDVEGLRDELQDWYDNLPEAFQSGDKGDQLQSAIDTLSSVADNTCDVPEAVGKIQVVHLPPLKCESRSDRLNEAVSALQDVVDELEEAQGLLQADAENSDLDDVRSHLSDAIDELGGVEFPGMY